MYEVYSWVVNQNWNSPYMQMFCMLILVPVAGIITTTYIYEE